MLGKILINTANLLLLDETTNHLDLDSCDSLLAAIKDFDCAVLMVTNDAVSYTHLTLPTKA